MRIDRVEPSPRKPGRVLVILEDGSCLSITEQELLDFGLYAGADLDEAVLPRLKTAAGASRVKAAAAELAGRRAMSRHELERKLRDRGAGEAEARYAAEWLEAIGALNDAEYAASLARRCAARGWGRRRLEEKLREKGVARELWEEALAHLPDEEEQVEAFLRGKLRGRTPDAEERKRLSAAALRRGFAWSDVRAAWAALSIETEDADER